MEQRSMEQMDRLEAALLPYDALTDEGKRKRDDSVDEDRLVRGKFGRLVRRLRRQLQHAALEQPTNLVVVQYISNSRNCADHSYRDFASVPQSSDYSGLPEQIADMTFGQKIHHLLSQEQFSTVIQWRAHGRAFHVRSPQLMASQGILQKYFDTDRYSTFIRLLSNYGFKHITRGKDRNCFYHECMLRGLPHLCKYLPMPRDARKFEPDPDHEPDFCEISKKFPLPDIVSS